ncbi:MAG: hypothetical protein ACR2HG_15565 [Pyrinomonadaceae bacterium]
MLKKLRQSKWFPVVWVAVFILLTLASRICVAYFLATDAPGDGAVYSQIAKNLLEQNVYSIETAAPFTPTLIRLPGQPLFIAGVYSIFGHDNNTAVRVVQAVFDTATCVIAALLAFLWTEDEERKKRNALWTFVLVSLCPFIVIYAATLLTETLTTFLMAAMTLTATLAFKSQSAIKILLWWIFTGLLAGAAVTLRPDSGLFAAGIGLTLVVSGLFLREKNPPKFFRRLLEVVWRGTVFSMAFILVLAPWAIRNYRVFGVFQPLAPAHAEMPGEFVAHGYDRWLRTWVDDSRFTEPMLWNLDEKPIRINKIPKSAFDSDEEQARIAALLEQYNNPPGSENQNKSAKSDDDDNNNSDDAADSGDDKNDDSADDSASSDDDKGDDNQADSSDDSGDNDDSDDDDKKYVVKMTPEIDAGFAAIADKKIERAPVRYYLFLPAKRAAALWFDSHSLYYPFGGQMSPVGDLDTDVNQQYWLPLFTALMWIYTLLAIGGAIFLWRNRADKNILRWLILLALMTLPRIVFFSTVENPEPRYVVELFVFAAILGGFYLGSFGNSREWRVENGEIDSFNSPFSTRLLSLDVFRGITIAAMILVNSPGTWGAIYAPLEHAEWNGATPTDFIFPFFLFIVGISIALGRRVETGNVNREIYLKICKRAFLLFALGLFLNVFPFYDLWKAEWFDPSTVRIMGVLQRIAVCYLISALIFLHTNWKRQAIIIGAILLIYWALMTLINVPGCDVTTFNDKTCNLAAYLDRLILTENHIWNQTKVFDPEGILSTLPAIATTLGGVLTGQWLRSKKSDFDKVAGVFFFGVVLTAIGWCWSFWFPINKSLWTSSYVVYTAGLALCFFGFCFWLIDIKGYKKWSKPFVVFGANAIALYVGSSIMSAILNFVQLDTRLDSTISLQEMIFKFFFAPLAAPVNASLLYAIWFVLIWWLIMCLLYRRRIFIKI